MNPIAVAALNKALRNVRAGPKRRPRYSSRTADKFVIRGFEELFEELKGIGHHQGRSMNSEAIAAILDALDGHVRSRMQVKILKSHLGEGVSDRVLAEVPDFDLSACSAPDSFVVRLPPSVRDVIRDGVKSATSGKVTMKDWMLEALVDWINIQRQEYALLTAAIAMEPNRLG